MRVERALQASMLLSCGRADCVNDGRRDAHEKEREKEKEKGRVCACVNERA